MRIFPVAAGMSPCNCYLLVSDKNRAAVVDPGGKPDKIQEAAREWGVEIAMILITHAHFDHIGGLEAVWRETGAEVYITGPEAATLENPGPYEKRCFTDGRPDAGMITKLVADGEVLPLDELAIEVIACPGHTPCGAVYRVGDTLFTGDTLFAGTVGRTDLAGGDWHKLMASLRKLAQLPGDYRVLPGHMGETTLARERAHNPFIKEAYEAL